MMYKKMKCLTLTSFLALSLVAHVVAKTYTVGLAVANLQADFFNQIKQSVIAEGKRSGVTVITVDAHGDSSAQVSQIQDLITRHVDAIIYIPAGASAAAVPVKAAKRAGIPVVTVDRNPEGAPGDSFIATDSVAAARTLGNYVARVTDGKGSVAMILGQVGTTPQIERSKGFSEALAKFPELKIVAQQASKMWAQNEGFSITQDILQRNPDINVIFGQADGLALGAAQAAKVAGKKVIVVGFDGDASALKALKAGKFDATMTQQTQYMGRLALRSAIDLANGLFVPPKQLMNATLTTKENVDQFIAVHP